MSDDWIISNILPGTNKLYCYIIWVIHLLKSKEQEPVHNEILMESKCWSCNNCKTLFQGVSSFFSHVRYTSSTGLLRTGWFPSVEISSCVYLFPAVPNFFIHLISPHSLSINMSLRLATPVVRSTARALARQQPMALVKIHSCE